MSSSRSLIKQFIAWIIPYDLFIRLKFELKILIMRIKNFLNPAYWIKVNRLKKQTDIKVHFACGTVYIEGWLNIDGLSSHKHDLTLDLRRKIPLANNSAAFIFCEHFVEHLAYPDGILYFFRECHRILKPGGILRVSVPDAGLYLKKYIENDNDFFNKERPGTQSHMEAINHVFRQGSQHLWAFDNEELARLIKKSSFPTVDQVEFGKSSHGAFSFDSPHRKGESLYMEAEK